VLANLGEKFQKLKLGEDSFSARFGGEEFIIFLKNITLEKTWEVGESLRNEVSLEPFILNEKELAISLSGGVASFPETHPKNYKDLIEKADHALYSAKKDGRDRIYKFSENE